MATGFVKLSVISPGFIQSTSSYPSNTQLCIICKEEIEDLIETCLPDDETLHNIISELLNIDIKDDLKVLEFLCKSCLGLLEDYHKLQIQLVIIRNTLQEAYQKGKFKLNSQISQLALIKASTKPTYVLFQSKNDDDQLGASVLQIVAPQMVVTEENDELIEIVEDNEQYEEFIIGSSASKEDIPIYSLYKKEEKSFFCGICEENSTIYDSKSIQLHLQQKHNKNISICQICESNFSSDAQLNDHILQFHSNDSTEDVPPLAPLSNKELKCNICNKVFSSDNLLEEHKHTHTRPHKCTEPNCGKTFTSKYTLASHIKIHAPRQRNYKCNICGKSFYHSQNLVQHIKLHSDIKDYECSDCSKKFSTQHNLDVHRIVHTQNKSYVCRFCSKAFARKAEISDHERTHTGEKPFKCDMCSSSFAQRSNLLSHKRATHLNDKRHKCEICNRAFKRRRLLDYHIKSMHTGERPHKCKICNATFVYPEHYKKHIKMHSGEKPFICDICQRAFSSKDNLKAHVFVHSQHKPYECSICNTGFMRKPLLITHMENQGHVSENIIMNQPKLVGDAIEIQKTLVPFSCKDYDSQDSD